METVRCTGNVDGLPVFEAPLKPLIMQVEPGGGVTIFSPDEFVTAQQRKWWKGVLLPALSKDTGDSEEFWETKLKLAVLPDDFAPFYVAIGKQVFPFVPSITKLGKKKMMLLIDGSIRHLRESPEYDGHFQWVTEPDASLRA